MNPLTNVRNTQKLNLRELNTVTTSSTSWHDYYRHSAYIFIGGLHYDMTEGDIISVFSQYGEVLSINLVKDKQTGKHKGYCFLCYEDQRSTILAVDNLNGIKLINRIIRVDHVKDYKLPEVKSLDDLAKYDCAPKLLDDDTKNDALSDKSYDSNEWIAAPKEKSQKKKKKKKDKKHNKDIDAMNDNRIVEIDESNLKDDKRNQLKRHKQRDANKLANTSNKRTKIDN